LQIGVPQISPRVVPDAATAIHQIKTRAVYGAYEAGTPEHLYISSAANDSAAVLLQTATTALAQHEHHQLVVDDIVPISRGDPRGLTLFYLVVVCVFAGYFAALSVGTATGATRLRRSSAIVQLGLFAGFSLVSAATLLLIAIPGIHAVPDHYWSLLPFVALIIFAVAAVTHALRALLGSIGGFAVAIVLLILLGNPASGGVSPPAFMPAFWRGLNTFVPNAAAVNGLTDIAYFPQASLLRPMITLLAWMVAGVGLFLLLGPKPTTTSRKVT
jgi:hypothetical protein